MTHSTHFTEIHPHLRATYEAMLELGLDESLLTFATIQPLEHHLSEPNGSLETDYLPELEQLLLSIKMPFNAWPNGSTFTQLPTIVLKSQGVGYDFGNGLSSGWTTTSVPPGGWRQRPTDTIDEVHIASLACSDAYWDVMPNRLKTVSALTRWLPELFDVESIGDIPRHRAYLVECLSTVSSSFVCQSWDGATVVLHDAGGLYGLDPALVAEIEAEWK